MISKLSYFLLGSLRRRLILGMSLITTCVITLFIWQVTQRHQVDMLKSSTDRAVALSQSISLSSATWLAARDYSGLQEIIQGLNAYPDLDYAIVLDKNGQVVAHSDTKRLGLYLQDIPQKIALTLTQSSNLSLDVLNPIMLGGSHLGWTRVGISNQTLVTDISRTQKEGFIYTLIAIILSLIFAALTGRYLMHRLYSIQEVTNAVQSGQASARVNIQGNDETAILARQINQMLDGLTAREAKIHQLAFYDSLTGLPNRASLLEKLENALTYCHQNNTSGAILFLDLDYFKTLNDTLGHDVGDILLQQVSERLKTCIINQVIAARLGGDEFVVLIEGLSQDISEAKNQTALIVNKVFQRLSQPYQLGSHEYNSTSSIGIALFNGQTQSREEVLKQADIAMYQAKKEGRHNYRFFDQHMQDDLTARAQLEQELSKAIERQQLELHYQMQVDEHSKAIGAEVLIRWHHPKQGMIPPIQFIPLAEETGLIIDIGYWVLQTACKQIKQWQLDAKTKDLSLAINVSAKQFLQVNFVSQVEKMIETTQINPNLLKLELTESIFLDKLDEIISAMNALKKIGVRFSLDDFGTGYSSLQYLKQLPLYQLKIDQSFVRDITSDVSDKVIVRTIIAMAKALNLNVIAEGVETEEQRQLLLRNDCHTYQGYLFSKPVPLAQFEALL